MAYELLLAGIASTPWWIAPALLAARLRTSSSLDDFAATAPPAADAPRVSVILPARNEAVHIVECLRSLRASTWPNLEVIIVDDHSTDGTGELARREADGDERVHVIPAPTLPAGWFGKQWACQVGAAQSTGSLLLFTDADTRHAPDLISRLVAARSARGAELMSVAGRQDMVTVWERAVQPSVYALILLRYGGTVDLERASRASDVVANGQCFLVSRVGYDAIGRHQAVRAYVAEDVMMAQAVWASGRRVSLVLGIQQLRTRMYDGLSSLMRGWGKNVYAGGRFGMRGGAVGRGLYPILLVAFPALLLCPFIALCFGVLAAITGAERASTEGANAAVNAWLLWSLLASIGVLGTFGLANRVNRDPAHRALLAPLGAAVLLAICLNAIRRGRHVEWKGRDYQSA
jgi:chlorobactene glucosyltransferase